MPETPRDIKQSESLSI